MPQSTEERFARLQEARDDADSWKDWYAMTPLERMADSMKLWQFAGGSLEAEYDTQSPFNDVMPHGTAPAYKKAGVIP